MVVVGLVVVVVLVVEVVVVGEVVVVALVVTDGEGILVGTKVVIFVLSVVLGTDGVVVSGL